MKNDQQLQADVVQELHWEPSVKAEHIGVSVKNGVVELDGHVTSYFEKWGAEKAAMRVSEARAVASEIKVEPLLSDVRTDEDIARAAATGLAWNASVPETVKVMVTDGWVTLRGTTEWHYQRDVAAATVRPLLGVKGILNEITITPKASFVDVKVKIENALKRTASSDAEHITVEIDGSRVTLRGDVRSWAARDDAERAAWGAPGVTAVEDLLQVG